MKSAILHSTIVRSLFALFFILAIQGQALACATCRKNSDDPSVLAADASIVFLGVLVMGILFSIFAFFGYIIYRSRNPLVDPEAVYAQMPDAEK